MALRKGGVANAVNIFFMFAIAAFCCAIIAINNRELYNVWGYCVGYPYYASCYISKEVCWISSDPQSSFSECKYLYAVGAVGLPLAMLGGIVACLDSFRSILAVGGIASLMNVGWWLAAGIFFQMEISDINDLSYPVPAGGWRTDIMAFIWTSFALSVVTLPLVFVIAKDAKHKHEDHYGRGTKEMAMPEAKVVEPPRAQVQAEAV